MVRATIDHLDEWRKSERLEGCFVATMHPGFSL